MKTADSERLRVSTFRFARHNDRLERSQIARNVDLVREAHESLETTARRYAAGACDYRALLNAARDAVDLERRAAEELARYMLEQGDHATIDQPVPR